MLLVVAGARVVVIVFVYFGIFCVGVGVVVFGGINVFGYVGVVCRYLVVGVPVLVLLMVFDMCMLVLLLVLMLLLSLLSVMMMVLAYLWYLVLVCVGVCSWCWR